MLVGGSVAGGAVFAGGAVLIVSTVDQADERLIDAVGIEGMIGLFLVSLLSNAARRLRGTPILIATDWLLWVFLGVRLVALAAVVLLGPVAGVASAAGLESATMLIDAVIFVLISGTMAIFASGIVFNIALAIRGPSPGSP